jgi:hypothetical protein
MPFSRVGIDTESRLLSVPESGMGYQIIRYRTAFWLIFNATLIIPFDEFQERRFTQEDYSLLSGDPDAQSNPRLEPFEIQDGFSIAFSVLDREYRDTSLNLVFNDTAISPPDTVISPKRPHSYYRFSAYNRDKRVAPDGSFIPGTYATTYNDMHFVPSGFAAVGRYALPNPASAQFVFPILTRDQPTLMSTATPNFGQAGGGVEVLFNNRAMNLTGLSFMINAG